MKITLMKFNSQLDNYIVEANTPRKKKVLLKMKTILLFIDEANISNSDINRLQQELDTYTLDEHEQMTNRALSKRFRLLQRFATKEFNFTHKGYYTAYFMALGMTLGLSIGSTVFDLTIGLSTGMMFGLFFGALIGRIKDQKAEKNKLVYNLRE